MIVTFFHAVVSVEWKGSVGRYTYADLEVQTPDEAKLDFGSCHNDILGNILQVMLNSQMQ